MSTILTASSAIALMSHGPSPAPVNTALNYRQGFVGALVSPAPGGPMSWRSGVFSTATGTGTHSQDLQVIALGTAGQGVSILAGNMVIARGAGSGPYLVGLNQEVTFALDAASTTNPRIDVIYALVNDDGIGDGGATNGAFFSVVLGTPGSSPVVPAVPAGAVALAQIYRNTVAGGGNAIIGSNITDVRPSTSVAGGIRAYLPGDSLSAAGAFPGDFTFDANSYGLRYWDGTTWRGTHSRRYVGTNQLALATGYSSGAGGNTVLMSCSVPDPGYPYKISAGGSYGGSAASGVFHVSVLVNGVQISTCYQIVSSGIWQTPLATALYNTELTGANTVQMIMYNDTNVSFTTSTVASVMNMTVEVVPSPTS